VAACCGGAWQWPAIAGGWAGLVGFISSGADPVPVFNLGRCGHFKLGGLFVPSISEASPCWALERFEQGLPARAPPSEALLDVPSRAGASRRIQPARGLTRIGRTASGDPHLITRGEGQRPPLLEQAGQTG